MPKLVGAILRSHLVLTLAGCMAGLPDLPELQPECGNGVLEGNEGCDDANGVADDGCLSCNLSSGWRCAGEPSVCTPICGDGTTIAGREACDDGNTDDCLGDCSADCSAHVTIAGCGDGHVCGVEVCDDGYTDACGSCNADCSGPGGDVLGTTACGDGLRCPESEACDDGFTDACGSCNADCSGPGSGATCGDGDTCPEDEACDDGYTDDCGSCNADCSGSGATALGLAYCGDGDTCPEFEACDDGYTDDCGSCDADCSGLGATALGLAFCGDGDTCPEFEACDDGNTDDCLGGCSGDCSTPVTVAGCGDGVVCGAEVCDDGFTDACGTCNADCTGYGPGIGCGDSVICAQYLEACDDGTDNSDGWRLWPHCNASCSALGPYCGDGLTDDPYEACDGGDAASDGWAWGPHCATDCSWAPSCGDGRTDVPYEACDDGGTSAGDGCSDDCQVEPGWQCGGQPSFCLRMVLVDAGSFLMGSPVGELGRESGGITETQHPVTLTHAFWIGSTEVTRATVLQLIGWDPTTDTNCTSGSCPAETLSWLDVLAIANAASARAGLPACYTFSNLQCSGGLPASTPHDCFNGTQQGIQDATISIPSGSVYACQGYRLPTEAEWELATRGGTSTMTWAGDYGPDDDDCTDANPLVDRLAWNCYNGAGHTHPVGLLDANSFGLYDVLGNVAEWSWDCAADFTSSPAIDPESGTSCVSKAVRGGSYEDWPPQNMLRSAARSQLDQALTYRAIGLRLARSAP